MSFIDKKYFFKFQVGYILIDLNLIFPIKPSNFENSILIEIFDEKNDKNDRNGYVDKNRIVSLLFKISVPNFNTSY